MGSEILCQFLLGNNEGILERPRKTVWTKMFFLYTHDWNPKRNVETLVDIAACRVKFTLQNALFYFLFVFQKSTFFQYDPHFEKSAFFM